MRDKYVMGMLTSGRPFTTRPVWQWDKGLTLVWPDAQAATLPETYEMHWSNEPRGTASVHVGTRDGVILPDEYVNSGKPVYGWVYVPSQDGSAVTVYDIIVPVTQRAQPSDYVPTPEEQTVIDEAIAALNDAVEKCEDAVEKTPHPDQNGIWLVWNAVTGEWESTGIQAYGKDGTDGTDYQITPEDYQAIAAEVAQNAQFQQLEEDIHEITYGTDKSGNPLPSTNPHSNNNAEHFCKQAEDFAEDAEGSKNAIQNMTAVAVTLPAGSAATVTKTVDPQTGAVTLTFGVPQGQSGSGTVNDVQIDGASILDAQGVANIPKADVNGTLGVVKIRNGDDGVVIYGNGNLGVSISSSNYIKYGTESRKVLVPNYQHESTFYGLAKAAGANLANVSGVTVGIYPEAQKSAISQMLNAPVSVSGSTPSITAKSGVQYVCGECATLDITLPASGIVDVIFESGSTATVLTITPPTGVTVKWANGFDPTSLEANTTYELNIKDGLGVAGKWS